MNYYKEIDNYATWILDFPSHVVQDEVWTSDLKMEEDVGMSKPKKHVNKVGKLT